MSELLPALLVIFAILAATAIISLVHKRRTKRAAPVTGAAPAPAADPKPPEPVKPYQPVFIRPRPHRSEERVCAAPQAASPPSRWTAPHMRRETYAHLLAERPPVPVPNPALAPRPFLRHRHSSSYTPPERGPRPRPISYAPAPATPSGDGGASAAAAAAASSAGAGAMATAAMTAIMFAPTFGAGDGGACS